MVTAPNHSKRIFYFVSCCALLRMELGEDLRLNNSEKKQEPYQSHIFQPKHTEKQNKKSHSIGPSTNSRHSSRGDTRCGVGKHTTIGEDGEQEKEKRCGNKIKTEILFPHLHLKSSERFFRKTNGKILFIWHPSRLSLSLTCPQLRHSSFVCSNPPLTPPTSREQ